jgi:uncharacterized membrane protein YdjX (TVP38/TMEM64 family)
VLGVATVRSLPVAPYGLVGYAYGTSAVRTRDYLVGTLLAGIPSAIVYSFIGAAVAGGGSTGLLTAVPTAISLVLVIILMVRARRRAATDPRQPTATDSRRSWSFPGELISNHTENPKIGAQE